MIGARALLQILTQRKLEGLFHFSSMEYVNVSTDIEPPAYPEYMTVLDNDSQMSEEADKSVTATYILKFSANPEYITVLDDNTQMPEDMEEADKDVKAIDLLEHQTDPEYMMVLDDDSQMPEGTDKVDKEQANVYEQLQRKKPLRKSTTKNSSRTKHWWRFCTAVLAASSVLLLVSVVILVSLMVAAWTQGTKMDSLYENGTESDGFQLNGTEIVPTMELNVPISYLFNFGTTVMDHTRRGFHS